MPRRPVTQPKYGPPSSHYDSGDRTPIEPFAWHPLIVTISTRFPFRRKLGELHRTQPARHTQHNRNRFVPPFRNSGTAFTSGVQKVVPTDMDCRHLDIVKTNGPRGSALVSYKCELAHGSSPNAVKFQKELMAITSGNLRSVTQGCPFRAADNYQSCPRFSV